MKSYSLMFAVLSLSACGKGIVTVDIAISDNNTRDITVEVGGQNRDATVDDLSMAFEEIAIDDENGTKVILAGDLIGFDIGGDAEFAVDFEDIKPDSFADLELVFGNADQALVDDLGQADLLDRALEIDGTVDLDGDGIQETDFVALITAPADPIELEEAFDVKRGAQVILEAQLDLEALFNGVDFATLVANANGELVIDPEDADNNNADAGDTVQGNLADSFVLVIEDAE